MSNYYKKYITSMPKRMANSLIPHLIDNNITFKFCKREIDKLDKEDDYVTLDVIVENYEKDMIYKETDRSQRLGNYAHDSMCVELHEEVKRLREEIKRLKKIIDEDMRICC